MEFRDDAKDKRLAHLLLLSLLRATRLASHGNDKRTDLAVLKFASGPAVLIELGFITNDRDRGFMLDGSNRDRICKAIFDTVSTAG